MSNATLLEAALNYAEQGYPVFPLKGKRPARTMGQGFGEATTNADIINQWWTYDFVGCNIGIPTGPASRFWVLDVDNKHPEANGLCTLESLAAEHGELPRTPLQITGNGKHYLFRYEGAEITNNVGDIGPGLDVRGKGGYIVVSPSVHPDTRQQYRWVEGSSLFEVEPAKPPEWLTQRATKRIAALSSPDQQQVGTADDQISPRYAYRALEDECRNIENALAGVQEITVNKAAFNMGTLVGAGVLSYQEALNALLAAAIKMPSHNRREPWTPRDLRSKIEHGLRDGMKHPRLVCPMMSAGTATAEQADMSEWLDRLNQRYAVVKVGSKCAILDQSPSALHEWEQFDFLPPSDFKMLYCNQTVSNGRQPEPMGKAWINHPARRQYEGVVFLPGPSPANHFNLWQGWPIKAVQSDKADKYLEHIRENIAGGDEAVYRYIMAFMADAIQNPATRPGVALVLRGDQGVGKGVFVHHFGSLFGPHYLQVSSAHHLLGNFNALMKDKLLVFADEAFWAGDKKAEGPLKALITEDTLPVELKNKDTFLIKSFIRLIVASNNEWVVPAAPSERRFCVIDVQPHRKQDHPYFAAIQEDMDSGGREALMYFLKHFDLTGVNLRTFPKTAALQDQKIRSMDVIERWWLDCLERGYVSHAGENWGERVSVADAFASLTEASNQAGQKTHSSQTAMGIKLTKIVPRLQKRRESKGTREYIYTLPSLEECRDHFASMMGLDNDWPEDCETGERTQNQENSLRDMILGKRH